MEPRKQSALNYVRHLVSQTSIVTPRGGGGKRGGVPVQHFVERSTAPYPPPPTPTLLARAFPSNVYYSFGHWGSSS